MPRRRDPRQAALDAVAEAISVVRTEITTSASARTLSRERTALQRLAQELSEVATDLDPVLRPTRVFDPSHPEVSSHIVALALVAQPRRALAGLPPFYGSGVYALYYAGQLHAYEAISGTEQPIYVGRARPAGRDAATSEDQGTALFARLKEHRDSIVEAENLDPSEFECRFLVVASGGETACEDYLIPLFRPVWNKETRVAQGIGKHGDSATTRGNRRSPWDTLHPGRPWAAATTEDQKSEEQIVRELRQHFTEHPAPADVQAIITKIVGDLEQFAQAAMQQERATAHAAADQTPTVGPVDAWDEADGVDFQVDVPASKPSP